MNFDQVAESCRSRIVPGPRIAVLGSTAFYGALSESICQILAADLAGTPEIVLLTGGVSGVGQTFGHAFFEARRSQQLPPNVYHLLPAEMAPVEYGVTLPAGDSLSDRREVRPCCQLQHHHRGGARYGARAGPQPSTTVFRSSRSPRPGAMPSSCTPPPTAPPPPSPTTGARSRWITFPPRRFPRPPLAWSAHCFASAEARKARAASLRD